jgi:hypothetical protein
MIFKIYDCDVGIKVNGVSYDFEHVDEVTWEDPENNRLTRGMNANNKTGLVYREGSKEPKRVTCPIMNMSVDLKTVLDDVYLNKTRVDLYVVSRSDGSSKMAKNAILCQQPQQLTVGESPESMNVNLIFESFDTVENHKS